MIKSKRNRTIDTPVHEGITYLTRCISVTERHDTLERVLNRTILGDMFTVCPLLPPNSVDLIIADPPYNLTKSFNGTTFSKKNRCRLRSLHEAMANCGQTITEIYRLHICLLRLENESDCWQSLG